MNGDSFIVMDVYPVQRNILNILLKDKTTEDTITFATDSYEYLGDNFRADSHITGAALLGIDPLTIQPRVLKKEKQQSDRTRKKAEVMTPSWLCNEMNNYLDEEWFGYSDVFNKSDGYDWTVREEPIRFPEEKTWKDYVDSRRLEITCGDYIVSRYDTTTGDLILPPKRRIGLLDRKLRVVGENTSTEEEWLKWAFRAFQSVYGFEFQGDSLLIARINLLITFVDYLKERWGRTATNSELKKLANIIAWNFWQMDGLTGCIPYRAKPAYEQMTLFDIEEPLKAEPLPCKIRDWRSKKTLFFNDLKK